MRQNKNILTTNVIVRSYIEIRTCNAFPERISWPLKFLFLQHTRSLSTFESLLVAAYQFRQNLFENVCFAFNCLIFECRAIHPVVSEHDDDDVDGVKLIRSSGIAWAVHLALYGLYDAETTLN